MKRTADYAVVYDISSTKERNRVVKVLKGFGFRVQKSVFECKLEKKGKENLIQKLKALEISTGFVKVYKLEFSSEKETIGEIKDDDIDSGQAFVV